jgi:hypothetical protein
MSLIYTEGYLESKLIDTSQQLLESNIKNILIVPSKNNTEDIQISIYQYSPFNPIYEIYILNNPISLKGDKLQKDSIYYIKTSRNTVRLYYEYEKEDN